MRDAQTAGADGRGVRLQTIDNGRGFDQRRPRGKGLLSMQERAHRQGAKRNRIAHPVSICSAACAPLQTQREPFPSPTGC